MRPPRDAEILVALIAGQIAGGYHANGNSFLPSTVVDHAESIIDEVYSRGHGLEDGVAECGACGSPAYEAHVPDCPVIEKRSRLRDVPAGTGYIDLPDGGVWIDGDACREGCGRPGFFLRGGCCRACKP